MTPSASRPFMPGYGVAAADEGAGLLPWAWAEQHLTSSRNFWLTTSNPDGRPHSMAVWAVWSDGRLLFSTGEQSRKYRNLARDPRCVMTTEHGDEAVIVEGTAHRTHDVALVRQLVDATKAKYDFDMGDMNEPVFALEPERVFAFMEADGQFTRTATRWLFK